MTKKETRTEKKKIQTGGLLKVFFISLTVGLIVVIAIFYNVWNQSLDVSKTPHNGNALSQQGSTTTTKEVETATTTTSTTTTTTTTTQTTTTEEDDDDDDTQSESTLQKPGAERLDEIGNSGLEFKTLDEAYNYGASILNDKEKLAALLAKNYRGYIVRSIRWTDNTYTYTIDWQ